MDMRIATFDSEAYCGYKQITTFFTDFSIADNFGVRAIKDTYNRAFKAWKENYKYFTELVMVLNWKSWQWNQDNNTYCKLYTDLYYQAHEWAMDNLDGDALMYYIRVTD